ncbi:TlpA disulfide reductase family protein [Streptomyces sp. NPDC001851]|uniref:TlpA family protein disulfide reductase n=1 Tax=Streptomyces sp. NPDC001851 TaxID=3154529 RepID=UPI00332B61F4
MRRRRVSRLLAPLVPLIALAACTPQQDPDNSAASPVIRVPAAERRAAPDLNGTALDGGRVRLSDYRGKVVVLNVWAAYCGPCRAEAPELSQAQRHLAAKGLQVVGVDTDADRSQGRAFASDHHLAYPSLYDPGSRQLVHRMPRKYLAQALPYTLFIDRNGKIAARGLAGLTEADVRTITRPLLAEKADGMR